MSRLSQRTFTGGDQRGRLPTEALMRAVLALFEKVVQFVQHP